MKKKRKKLNRRKLKIIMKEQNQHLAPGLDQVQDQARVQGCPLELAPGFQRGLRRVPDTVLAHPPKPPPEQTVLRALRGPEVDLNPGANLEADLRVNLDPEVVLQVVHDRVPNIVLVRHHTRPIVPAIPERILAPVVRSRGHQVALDRVPEVVLLPARPHVIVNLTSFIFLAANNTLEHVCIKF